MAAVNHTDRKSLANAAYWLFIIGAVLAFLIYFRSFLQPLVLGLGLWFLIRELNQFIGKITIGGRKLPSWLRGIISFGVVLGFIFGVSQIVALSIRRIREKTPEYEETFSTVMEQVEGLLGNDLLGGQISDFISSLQVPQYFSNVLGSFTGILSGIILIVIYLIFLQIESKYFAKKIKAFFSNEERYEEVGQIQTQITQSIRHYLTVKTLMSLLTGVLSYIALVFIGVDFPTLWAFFIFLFNYIPNIGSLVATLLPAIFAIFQFSSFPYFFWVILGIAPIQVLVGNLLEPRVMGNTLNLSPLVVIISLFFWGTIWGIPGMFLSVPITSLLTIILAHFPGTQKIAILLSEGGEIQSMLSNTEKKIVTTNNIPSHTKES